MGTLLQDFRYGIRTLAKNRGFTAVALLTLALGIGANAAIFSVVNTVLLEHLPIRAADRLVVIWIRNLAHGWSRVGPTGRDYLDWREQNRSFEDMFLFEHGTGTVTGVGEPEQVSGLRVTTNFGDFFGIKPVLGRTFRLDEARGRHNLLLLSYGYWQRRFGSDPDVVGRGITLNSELYTIIGVIPASFAALFPMDVVVPFDNDWVKRADSDLGVFGRPKPGITLEQASAEMSLIAQRIESQRLDRKGWGVVLVPLEAVRVEYIRPALLLLLGGVAFVLLIACVNVANLLLVRAVSREREVAMRMALGAGRLRLIRQFLSESTLLALGGGGAGLLLAAWGTDLLMRVMPSRIPVPNAADAVLLPKIHMDAKVVLFTLVVSLLTGTIFGLIPAFQGARCDVNESLKEGGRGFLAGREAHRARAALVIGEAALAVVLVIGAGLMIKSFWRLLEANPGLQSAAPAHPANQTAQRHQRLKIQGTAAAGINLRAVPGQRRGHARSSFGGTHRDYSPEPGRHGYGALHRQRGAALGAGRGPRGRFQRCECELLWDDGDSSPPGAGIHGARQCGWPAGGDRRCDAGAALFPEPGPVRKTLAVRGGFAAVGNRGRSRRCTRYGIRSAAASHDLSSVPANR